AIADIEFDAEVAVGSAGIMACRQHDAAQGLVFADDVRGSRRRQEPVAADEHMAEAIRRRHAYRNFRDFAIEVTAVAADDENLAFSVVEHIEDRLDEILDIVRLLKHRDLLAQARGPGLLSIERLGGDGCDHVFYLAFFPLLPRSFAGEGGAKRRMRAGALER